MRTIPPGISIPLVMGIVVLLILAFPGGLYAHDISAARPQWVGSDSQPVLAVVIPHRTSSSALVRNRERHAKDSWLIDADVRLRAAAALVGNPAIEKAAESPRVPLRMIVITASQLLEV